MEQDKTKLKDKKDRDIILNALRMGASLEDIATLVNKPVAEIKSMQIPLPTLYEYTQSVAEICYDRGVTDGMAKGEERLGKLVGKLFHDGHTVDAERVAIDDKVRKHFFKKYNM